MSHSCLFVDVFLSVFDKCTLAGLAIERTTTEVVDAFCAIKVNGLNDGTDVCGVIFHLKVYIAIVSIGREIRNTIIIGSSTMQTGTTIC